MHSLVIGAVSALSLEAQMKLAQQRSEKKAAPTSGRKTSTSASEDKKEDSAGTGVFTGLQKRQNVQRSYRTNKQTTNTY